MCFIVDYNAYCCSAIPAFYYKKEIIKGDYYFPWRNRK